MRLLSALVQSLFGCTHKAESWPVRRADGRDYTICLQCGRVRLSKIQFGSRKQAPLPAATGIDRMRGDIA
jgi:hypothetical protein